jgi:hypothetical protein
MKPGKTCHETKKEEENNCELLLPLESKTLTCLGSCCARTRRRREKRVNEPKKRE